MKIGIFGGSFNPLHDGHIRLAETALSELNLDKIIFLPSFQTPLKKKILFLPLEERLRLLKASLRKYPCFEVSDWEIQRGRVTYTVDAIRHFKAFFGANTTLYFLCGADVLKNLSRWKSLDSVLKLCRFCVFSRPGYPLRKRLSDRIVWVPMEALDMSSTQMRQSRPVKNRVKGESS